MTEASTETNQVQNPAVPHAYVPPTSGWAVLLWIIAVIAAIASLINFGEMGSKSTYGGMRQYYMMLGIANGIAAVMFGAFGAVINELVRIRTWLEPKRIQTGALQPPLPGSAQS